MDYLDTQKEFRHRIILFVGYALIAVAITTSTLVLLYQAYGFGVTKNGTVIQNGLTFFSSQPNPARIYVNGVLNSAKTNTRLVLPENIYHIKLTRDGYRDWQRTINLNGGDVEHFDYPMLFPKELVTKKIQTYDATPSLMTQSPDKRWLLITQANSLTAIDVYDLKNPTKAATAITLPATLLTKATTGESLELVEWAGDNQHVLVRHNYDNKKEYVLIDRNDPAQSINVSTTLPTTAPTITLDNKKYDRYYLYDSATMDLQTASIKAPSPVTRLQGVLAYKSYSDDTVLYATATNAPTGRVFIRLITGNKTSSIRTVPVAQTYLVDLTKYDGTMYVVAGSSSDAKVYIYRDPVGQLNAKPTQAVVPTQVLHVEQPNYLSFSANTQFIVAENDTRFGVYDIENKLGYNYQTKTPLDAPQAHASWMDGNRLVYVSKGKLTVADYDNANRQTLSAAASQYLPAFTPNYRLMYSLVPAATAGQFELTQTALLTPADQ